MKKLIICTITALFATVAVSIAAPDKDAMMAMEIAAWHAFKEKNAAAFKKVVAADFLGVYAQGVSDMKTELDNMQKWDMKSFAISDYTALASGADTMVSTYKVTVDGTYDGKDASGTYNAGSVWKMKEGAWQAIFHTNVKVESAAKSTVQLPRPTPATGQPNEDQTGQPNEDQRPPDLPRTIPPETLMPPGSVGRRLQEIQRLSPAERQQKLNELIGVSPPPNHSETKTPNTDGE
jgi:hypothetical protein